MIQIYICICVCVCVYVCMYVCICCCLVAKLCPRQECWNGLPFPIYTHSFLGSFLL